MASAVGNGIVLHEEDLTEKIIGAAIEVHRHLGPGLLESAYAACLCRELELRELKYRKEAGLPLEYKGIRLECGYRLDLIVEEKVVVEVKCVETVLPIHLAQLLTYLRLTACRVGLLLNFKVEAMRLGIHRRVL